MKGVARCLRVLLAIVLIAPLARGLPSAADEPASISGRFLVASPRMADPNFSRTVIYMVAHDGDGAFGLVINRALGDAALAALLAAFGIETAAGRGDIRLHLGGPVQLERGFVLHSRDWDGDATVVLGPTLALSTGRDALEAIASGRGPARHLVLLGYAGWAAGQLDAEIARDDWLIAPADDAFIFAADPADIWDEVMKKAGMPL
jgi:putative transcriptional regulator